MIVKGQGVKRTLITDTMNTWTSDPGIVKPVRLKYLGNGEDAHSLCPHTPSRNELQAEQILLQYPPNEL